MPQIKGRKILIIDDEKEVCSLLEEFFEEEGYTADVAYNGEEGIKKISSFKPDVVLLDVRMPLMGGFEMLEKIKDISVAPVIIVTGVSGINIAEKCIELGAHSYMKKPIDLENLKTRIEKVLEI